MRHLGLLHQTLVLHEPAEQLAVARQVNRAPVVGPPHLSVDPDLRGRREVLGRERLDRRRHCAGVDDDDAQRRRDNHDGGGGREGARRGGGDES